MEGPILGVVDGITDAGAALFIDGALAAAVNEERLTRNKLQGGFPARSIAEVLRVGGVAPGDVRSVQVAGINTPSLATRLFRPLQHRLAETAGIVFDRPWSPLQRLADFTRYRMRLTTNRPGSTLGRIEGRAARVRLQRELPGGISAPVSLVEHHTAHAATAFFAGPFERALVVTADSLGDGLSLTVSRGEGRQLVRLWSADPFVSFGTFFALVTKFLGFRPYRHEGKVAALAASGDASRIPVAFPLRLEGEGIVFEGAWGLKAWRWLECLSGLAREDVAAWLQDGTEAGLAGIVERFATRTGLTDLCVSGGLFANVRLNLRLLETPGVERLFVYPHMGDGGLAVGAVLAHLRPESWTLPTLFLGPAYDARDCARALDGLDFVQPADPEEEVAEILAQGGVVGRFCGRMEYGPRALGHRSVFAEAIDPEIQTELNRRLDRTEFMPFAPVMLADGAGDRVADIDRARESTRHMTCAFRAKPELVKEAPATVHTDGTARCQVATPEEVPGACRMLRAYARRTKRSTLIHTSFNRHEEPLVCTPDDAAKTFREGGLDALLLGPYLVRNRKTR